jgi:hypothetical protein
LLTTAILATDEPFLDIQHPGYGDSDEDSYEDEDDDASDDDEYFEDRRHFLPI